MLRDPRTGLVYKTRIGFAVDSGVDFIRSEFLHVNPVSRRIMYIFTPFVILGEYIDSFAKEYKVEKIK